MPYQYNPTGANNGMFAPAYIAGNPQSQAAVDAWNAQNLQPRPTTPAAPPATPTAPAFGGMMPGAGAPSDFRDRIAQIMAMRAQMMGNRGGANPLFQGAAQFGGALADKFLPGGSAPAGVPGAVGPTSVGGAAGPAPLVQPAGTDSSGGSFTFRDPALSPVQQPGATTTQPQFNIPGPVGAALNSPVMQPYLNTIKSGFQQSPATAVAQQVGGKIFGG